MYIINDFIYLHTVSASSVALRDWTSDDYRDYLLSKRKARVQQDTTPRLKTKLCFYFLNHPNGCPLPDAACRFAHGGSDLRTDSLDTCGLRTDSLDTSGLKTDNIDIEPTI